MTFLNITFCDFIPQRFDDLYRKVPTFHIIEKHHYYSTFQKFLIYFNTHYTYITLNICCLNRY